MESTFPTGITEDLHEEHCRSTLHPHLGIGRRATQMIVSLVVKQSARILLRCFMTLPTTIQKEGRSSVGTIGERCYECKQRRKAPAQARAPVHCLSGSNFDPGDDVGRPGDLRVRAAAGGPHATQGLIESLSTSLQGLSASGLSASLTAKRSCTAASWSSDVATSHRRARSTSRRL
jgi:hypothetical protein